MPRKISEVFNVEPDALASEGVLDSFIDIDSQFHVDPHLLITPTATELQGTHDIFEAHFEDVIRILRQSKRCGDAMYREAHRRLIFPEVPHIGLGYSEKGRPGSGIGPKLARNLTDTAAAIIGAGIEDPAIFELVGLLEDGIGADRISDMTIRIILPKLVELSQRAARNLGIPTIRWTVFGSDYDLPYSQQEHRGIVLMPREILRDLPIAEDWSDIDTVCAHNEELRARVNEIIGHSWRTATRSITKRELRNTLLRYPDALRDLIGQYKNKAPEQYDFERDPSGNLIWHELGHDYAARYPLALDDTLLSPEHLQVMVLGICEQFRKLVEDNGMFAVFYSDEQKLRNERFAQLLFFSVADSYCEANNLDLSREANAGRGPVDFKVTRGQDMRVNVEVKYSSNTQLVKGYLNQLPIYDRAERTHYSVYLVIQTTKSESSINRVRAERQAALDAGNRAPEIVVIDGRWKPSASKGGA